MIRVLSFIGTRPEAIKMAPIALALEQRKNQFASTLCATGQHREMLDQALGLFQLKPDVDLDVMEADQSLSTLSGKLFCTMDEVVRNVSPDWILAQGDTTTVMVASLMAFYAKIPFGHVEAGLRTHDRFHPFPEEINRRIADLAATAHFAPTQRAAAALKSEGCSEDEVFVTGNTVIDALLQVAEMPCDWSREPLCQIPEDKRWVLVTAHRRESFGNNFREICRAIREVAQRFKQEVHVIYPVHLNPNVRAPVYELLAEIDNISLIEPLDYLSLVHVMKRSTLVLTDSGGIQEEAPSLGVPVLVMREVTERQEGVEAGVVKLVGTQRESIVEGVSALLEDETRRSGMIASQNPYGDGQAATRIIDILEQW